MEWARKDIITLPELELPLLIELSNCIENKQKYSCTKFLEYFERGTGVIGGTLKSKGTTSMA
ncbi:MAG: hypothetical protein QNJ54_30410 [Prochloraceae cyanobacterium]|nr:hypothetical protein [Prochloraceae cyanobacterium]